MFYRSGPDLAGMGDIGEIGVAVLLGTGANFYHSKSRTRILFREISRQAEPDYRCDTRA
jgi:hypothetical protein